MKKLISLTAAILLAITSASAQNYTWGLGARIGGETAGVSVKHFFDAANAIEGTVAFPYKGGFLFTALYERHIPVISHDFTFYYGGGLHIGEWDHHQFAFGIDGIVGLEYKIPKAPIALSIDYKPALNFAKHFHGHFLDFGLGVKYTF